MDLGNCFSYQVSTNTADLRLVEPGVCRGVPGICFLDSRIPTQLPIPVSPCGLVQQVPADLVRYFIIHNIATNNDEVVRYAALLRGTESAWQAVSYGVSSITVVAQVGGVYANFALWAVSIVPAWLVVRHFGTHNESSYQGSEEDKERDEGVRG